MAGYMYYGLRFSTLSAVSTNKVHNNTLAQVCIFPVYDDNAHQTKSYIQISEITDDPLLPPDFIIALELKQSKYKINPARGIPGRCILNFTYKGPLDKEEAEGYIFDFDSEADCVHMQSKLNKILVNRRAG